MAVYGYCRVSTVRQVDEGESLDVQQRQLEGYAHMHDLAITEIAVEKGVSGSIPIEQRPVGGALFARLESGDIVIAAKLDRLFRSALDALKVVASFRERGVNLHLLDLGGDIAGNGLSKLFLTIAAAFAEAERDRIRERIGQSKADQKARGRYLGGIVPFGFRLGGPDDRELVRHQGEQEAIREMIRLRIEERQPLRVVVEAMAAQGHKISIQGVDNIVRASRQTAKISAAA
jgi:putative DNA-invertase from lambdoid prophage Rac